MTPSSLAIQRYGEGPHLALAAHGITASSRSWPAVAAALADDSPLTADERAARSGLANRQVTIR